MPDLIGHVDPERWLEAFDRTGFVCLLGRGYVREVIVNVEGRKERCYEITEAGRAALEGRGYECTGRK
jgi:hypothetical protein